MARYEAMISSMTKQERADPELLALNISRRRRVARGSGHKEKDVSELMGVYTGMRSQFKRLAKMMQSGGVLSHHEIWMCHSRISRLCAKVIENLT